MVSRTVLARAKWLQTAANIFDPIRGDGGITVTAARAEGRLDLNDEAAN